VIHKLGKLASIVGILAFVYMFITLLLSADLSALAHNNHFSLPTFLLAVSLSSSWQIAFCPYVSDYSRYLPRDVSATKTWCSVFSAPYWVPNVDDARGSDGGHCRQRVPWSRGELSGGIR
jgi:purine-cytosine permease-like protein